MPQVGNCAQDQQRTLSVDGEPARPVFGPVRPDDGPPALTRTQNGAGKQPFLLNDRASEKTEKGEAAYHRNPKCQECRDQ